MKKIHLFGNWKMNMSRRATDSFFKVLADKIGAVPDTVDIAVFPPSVYLDQAHQAILDLGMEPRISLGIQNVYHEDKGAFTGEISPAMALDSGATYSILGHSERRALFGETSEVIGKKLSFCLSSGLKPVLCVGETLDQRDRGEAWRVVEDQLFVGLSGVCDPSCLMVAYEPVWAIGTGRSASPDDAQEMCRSIRLWLKRRFNCDRIPILYGGSVKPDNSKELFSMDDIDGGLVGGASLDPNAFLNMAI